MKALFTLFFLFVTISATAQPEFPLMGISVAVGTYTKIASETSAGGNSGFEKYNLDLLAQNPNFTSLTVRFYAELLRDYNLNSYNRLKNSLRPFVSLGDVAGSGRFQNLPKGLALNLAMEYSNGNANLAFAMLGICGHDDIISDDPVIPVDHPEFEFLKQHLTNAIESNIQHLNTLRNFPGEDWAGIDREIRMYKSYIESAKFGAIPCNLIVATKVPQSLGVQADTSPATKSRLIQIQGRGRGPTALSAKYYHVVGSAALACLAKQKTDLPYLPELLASFGARLYRGKRIYEKVEYSYPSNQDEDLFYLTKERRRQNAKRDAELLWKKWYGTLKLPLVGGVSLPRPNARVEARIMLARAQGMGVSLNGNICGHDWHNSRCTEALKILEEWELDFDWTQEQHVTGAKLATSLCKKTNESLESMAIRAMKN